MARSLVEVIDSSGILSQRRKAWADKHERAGDCYINTRGVYVFGLKPVCPADTRAVEPPAPKRAYMRVVLRVNEPEPSTGGAPFQHYPMPRATGGRRGLRAQYPTLAKAGAGL